MTHQQHKTHYLDSCFKPGSFVYWRQRTYQVEQPNHAAIDPLTIWLKDIKTDEFVDVSVTELLLDGQHSHRAEPIFAPTLAKLIQATQEKNLPRPAAPDSTLPQKLLAKADKMIKTVETVQQLLREQEISAIQAEKVGYSLLLKQSCARLDNPISLSTYYKYRKLYRQHYGDRVQMAAALRRKTANQIQLNKGQLHFIDTIILRYYAGKRSIRLNPHKLYELAQSILERTGRLWLNPDNCPGAGAENLIEELLNVHLPMKVILDNPEKSTWLSEIKLPSQSWFYGYLRWFETQPAQGQELIIERHGKEMWEREFMIFDTFVHRAVRPLEYVFADHWLVDVFIVDEATRSRLDRLWLTLLIDTFSRSVLGLALLYEAPCIESIQNALYHAIWPKTSHQEVGLELDWACYGIPQQIYLDNAWAHHSHSLEQLARAISQGGQYNSIDLVFRPPYRGRYGALIERLFGNFSAQMKDLLPGAILSSSANDIGNAASRACLLYRDIYRIVHQLIIKYQHTPHRELEGLTPHQKWLEGWQLGYGGWPPPLTPAIKRLFWRRSSETRVINRKGISVFNMNYWSPELGKLPRKDIHGQSIAYGFSYEPDDISRLAIFQGQQWKGDVYAKQLRRADGSCRPISLWERKMAQALARDRGQASQDWLYFITHLDELGQQRMREKRQAKRKAGSKTEPLPFGTKMPAEQETTTLSDPDYTELLLDFVGEPMDRS